MLFSNYFTDSNKNLILILFKIFLAFTIYFNSFSLAHAAARDLWKYEPTLKDMKVNVTAHKVDHLGNAVNDNKYKTQIDPKTAANKTAQGKVGMNRLLRVSGWGLVGAAALEALLNAVDWVIDPESQSIWRNKKNNGPSYKCEYYSKTGEILLFKAFGVESRCPLTAVNEGLDVWVISNQYKSAEFISWVKPDPFKDLNGGSSVFYEHDVVRKTGDRTTAVRTLSVRLDPDQTPSVAPDREVMTPDELSDYINHDHPDYSNPELAPKLEPHYKPDKIIPPLWTPQNDFEYDNSPTVDIIKKDLDKKNPTSSDPEVKPNPDTGGMTLPSFCDWATVVCDFVEDFNQEPEKENHKDLEIDETLPEASEKINVSIGDNTCPSMPVSIHTPFSNINTDISPTYLCDQANGMKLFFIALGFYHAALIVGRRN